MRDHVKGGALTETTFLVLLAVLKPSHGYGVMQYIEQVTQGRLTLGAGTLYGAINTLVEKKWITPYGNTSDNRKQYIITELGMQIVHTELARLKSIADLAEQLLKEDRE